MSQQARDGDRDAAIDVVKAAFASGRIIEADRDMRIEQLKHAQTNDEIAMHIRDLLPDEPHPTVAPTFGYGPPVAGGYVSLGDLKPKVSASKIIVPLAIVLVIAVVFIGGILALVGNSLVDSIEEVGSDSGSAEADVLSVEGYADLLAAIEEQTGSTIAFSAVMYPTYAVVELPVDGTSQREEYWYWDGSDLTRNDVKSTSSWERVDLSTVDPAVIVDLVDQARGNLEDATSWYAIVRAPDDDKAMIWAYATNEYSETAYLGARRNGTITYDSTAP